MTHLQGEKTGIGIRSGILLESTVFRVHLGISETPGFHPEKKEKELCSGKEEYTNDQPDSSLFFSLAAIIPLAGGGIALYASRKQRRSRQRCRSALSQKAEKLLRLELAWKISSILMKQMPGGRGKRPPSLQCRMFTTLELCKTQEPENFSSARAGEKFLSHRIP